MVDHFEELSEVNDLIESGAEQKAREALIVLLDMIKRNGGTYSQLVNHMIRRVGLFPYLQEENLHWQDRFALEAFRVDVGEDVAKPLHREQSMLLSKLVSGQSVAVSAPTSFGKSFVIDAFISINRPKSVLIIVPTIALMDESRRRLQRKFGSSYQVVTTTDVDPPKGNVIYIFPQERAMSYASRINYLDIFIVDEFYKASAEFDKARSPALVRAILRFSSITKQRYFLAPNIARLRENPLTKGMEFLKIDFGTVVLRVHDLSAAIAGNVEKKNRALRKIVEEHDGRCLIYAGSHSQVSAIANVLVASQKGVASLLLADFSDWLKRNYSPDWILPRLVLKGVGLHNGQLHRSLSQIQVRLFDEVGGLGVIISTSSIIEGVNTSADTVVIWNNKNGTSKLTDFDYKNILGRSGRMFKHFIGEVYVFEKPPAGREESLDLPLPDELLGMEEVDSLRDELSDEQREKADKYAADMDSIFDFFAVRQMQAEGQLQSSDGFQIAKIVRSVREDVSGWACLAFLNSDDVGRWEAPLYRVINLDRGGWGGGHRDIVAFVKVASAGWSEPIPQQLKSLSRYGIGIDSYFKLERTVSFKLSSLLGDINAIHARLHPSRSFDISRFIFRLSHAFLPPLVFQLEELGLPRMICKRIQDQGLIDFTNQESNLQQVVGALRDQAVEVERRVLRGAFESYLFKHFIEGVSSKHQAPKL